MASRRRNRRVCGEREKYLCVRACVECDAVRVDIYIHTDRHTHKGERAG